MQDLILKPFTIPSERNVKTHCQLCNQEFTLTRREHMCKRCFQAVCDDCSPYKVWSYRADLHHRLHRMCKTCHVESETLKKYAENYKVCWGEDSDMCRLWLKQLGYKTFRQSSRYSQKVKTEFNVKIEQLWQSLNFSFREFLGITIDKSNTTNEQIIQTINICLTDLCSSKTIHKEYTIYILMFFLAHCSPSNALLLTRSVLQILSLEQPSTQNITNFLIQLNCNDIESYKMENFLEQYLEYLIKSATVNYFTTEITIEIINSIIAKRNFVELEKGIAFVLNQRKQFICRNSNKSEQILIDILRHANTLNYRSQMKQLNSQYSSQNNNTNSLYSRSETSTLFTDHRVEKLIRENQELKIKNKNQEDQIAKLTAENTRYQQRQRETLMQREDKWSKVRKKSDIFTNQVNQSFRGERSSIIHIEIDDNEPFQRQSHAYRGSKQIPFLQCEKSQKVKDRVREIIQENFPQFEQFQRYQRVLFQLQQKYGIKQSQSDLNRKHKQFCKKNLALKRFSTASRVPEKRFSINSDTKKKGNKKAQSEEKIDMNNEYSNENISEILNRKNEEIVKLRKQINFYKYTIEENQKEQKSLTLKLSNFKKINEQIIQQTANVKAKNEKMVNQNEKMQEMNRNLMLKIRQLSNLLMDKEEMQCSKSDESFQQLAKQYYDQTMKNDSGCVIF